VAAIPPSAFYHDPADGRKLVRFAFCKDEQTLRDALDRLAVLRD
jgi:aspartate/methionine/tyrosine aminotransferase